jgi:hypothetical protein
LEATVSQAVCDERHKALENYLSNDKKMLQEHDLEIKDFKEAMVVLTAIQARHEKGLDDHEGRIRGIESKPGKRWDSIVNQIIQLILAAGIGGFIGKMV